MMAFLKLGHGHPDAGPPPKKIVATVPAPVRHRPPNLFKRILARIVDPFRRSLARLFLVVDRNHPIARPGMPLLKARVLARIAARNQGRRRRREIKRLAKRIGRRAA